MESIGADHEIELAFRPVFERDADGFVGLLNPRDAVAEDCLDPAFELAEDGRGQLRSRKADIAASGRLGNDVDREAGDAFAVSVHDPDLLDHVAFFAELRQQPHTIRDIEARAPEVDDVAACAQRGRLLHDGRLEAVVGQPVGQGRSRNPRARYQDSHDGNP